MAKKQTKPGKKQVKDTKEVYVSPTSKWWGKAIIWILVFAMVAGILFGLILALKDVL